MLKTTHRTVQNYETRISSFSDWADGSESVKADVVRQKVIGEVQKLKMSKSPRLLDVGCANGRDLAYFLKAGFEVVGLEPSKSFVDIAKARVNNVILGDIADSTILPTLLREGKFDVMFCLASLFHIPKTKLDGDVFNNIKQLLNENGLLLTSFPMEWFNSEEGHEMSDGRWCSSYSMSKHVELLYSHKFVPLQQFEINIYNGNWGCIVSQYKPKTH